jgi:hypothetical protein
VLRDADRADARPTAAVGAVLTSAYSGLREKGRADMAKVLCRFRWQTSPPHTAGFVRPTCALRFAPSRYTCPPFLWMMSHASRTPSSKTPNVDGYVICGRGVRNAPRRS